MSAFDQDFNWQLGFLEPIRKIVGPLLLVPAPLECDMQEATDMLVLLARDMKIACRVRRPTYGNFRWEFTIRSSRPNGVTTELRKIVDGFGDWMFYGHATKADEPAFSYWHVIDLHAFRSHLIRDWHHVLVPKAIANGDGTKFIPFDVRDFPPDPPILVASNVTEEATCSIASPKRQLTMTF